MALEGQAELVFCVTGKQYRPELESPCLPQRKESDMGSHFFGTVIGATVSLFVLWFAANVLVVALEGMSVVPREIRPSWRSRVDGAMVMLPVLAAIAAALMKG